MPLFIRRCVACLTVIAGFVAVPGGVTDAEETVEFKTEIPVRLEYLLHLPKDYESGDKWPLVLFLHGSGERGSDINLVKVHGPPKLASKGKDFPFVLISPQCPKGFRWHPVELNALLDHAIEHYNVDADRVYVTGLSMGGFGTFALANYCPERIAAIAPICGGGESFWAKRIKGVPMWAFHGAKDTAVPLRRSEEIIEAVRKVGGDVKLTVYPEAGHDSWTESYNNPELYNWLLSHRKGASKSGEKTESE